MIKAVVMRESHSRIFVYCAMNRSASNDLSIFFFQAEDGIRDIGVTGVQTCALPIYTNFVLVEINFFVANNYWYSICSGGSAFLLPSVYSLITQDKKYGFYSDTPLEWQLVIIHLHKVFSKIIQPVIRSKTTKTSSNRFLSESSYHTQKTVSGRLNQFIVLCTC